MKQKSYEARKRQTALAIALVLSFIGVFTFVYWFVAVPLIWSALPAHGWPPFWFHIYSGVAFLVWAAVVALALLALWFHRRRNSRVQPATTSNIGPGCVVDGPGYPTKLSLVQPHDASDKPQQLPEGSSKNPYKEAFTPPDDDLSSQDDSSTRSLQTVVPNAQYKETNPVDIPRKVIPAKDNAKKISFTESESSVDATPMTVPSGSKENEQPQVEKSSVMIRKKPGLTLEISKESEDSEPTQLSPRELYFRDLLKKAEDGQIRTVSRERLDNRKSMPISTSQGPPALLAKNTQRVVSQGHEPSKPGVARTRKSSEEYFIAQVSPTTVNTSEVHMFIVDDCKSSSPTIKWRLVSDGGELCSHESQYAGKIEEFIDNERRHTERARDDEESTADDSVF